MNSKLINIRQSISSFNQKSNIRWTKIEAKKICDNTGSNLNFDVEIEAWAYLQSLGIAIWNFNYNVRPVHEYFKNRLIEKNGHINWGRVKYFKNHNKGT